MESSHLLTLNSRANRLPSKPTSVSPVHL